MGFDYDTYFAEPEPVGSEPKLDHRSPWLEGVVNFRFYQDAKVGDPATSVPNPQYYGLDGLQTAQLGHSVYKPGVRRINVVGRVCKLDVKEFELENTHPSSTTNKRVVAIVTDESKEGQPHDAYVKIYPGWGHLAASFMSEDFLQLVFDALAAQGYENPCLIGVNTNGRGTAEYNSKENLEKLAKVGLDVEQQDAVEIDKYLYETGVIDKDSDAPSFVIGHSIASYAVEALVQALLTDEASFGNMKGKLATMLFGPVNTQMHGLMDMHFIGAVLPVSLKSVFKTLRGKGALELSDAFIRRVMLAAKNKDVNSIVDDPEFTRLCCVPDSPRRFLEAVLCFANRLDEARATMGRNLMPMRFVHGASDNIVSSEIVQAEFDAFAAAYAEALQDLQSEVISANTGAQVAEAVQITEVPGLTHSLPTRLSDNVRRDLAATLEEFFGTLKPKPAN